MPNDFQIACCVCGRVKEGDLWSEEPKAPESTNLSHGYCPQCAVDAVERDGMDATWFKARVEEERLKRLALLRGT